MILEYLVFPENVFELFAGRSEMLKTVGSPLADPSSSSSSASPSHPVSKHPSSLTVRKTSTPDDVRHTDPDLRVSARAIRYIFQARFQDANYLLTSNKNSSTSAALSATHSFVSFTQALISYESDTISEAVGLWKQTEKLCTASKNDPVEDRLEQKVVLADAKICSTFLQLLQSADFGGLFKGGWSLRQAWKFYQGTYDDMLKEIESDLRNGDLTSAEAAVLRHDLPHPFQGENGAGSAPWRENGVDSATGAPCRPGVSNSATGAPCRPSVLSPSAHFLRLHQVMGSVCYGYGCFHLMLSLLPGHLLKWLKFLGFEGDLHVGIRALTYCMNSPDSKSLLARMTLIWFHTVIQTYYAIDEDQMQEGIDSAAVLLGELDDELLASPLVQFFDCRLKRFKGDFEGAIKSYTASLESSTYVKEINVLIHHEIGILRFQLQEWNLSVDHLLKCFHEGRWGKILYAYMIGLCYGMLKDSKKAHEFISQVPSLSVMKGAPLEMFLTDRATLLTKHFNDTFVTPSVSSLLAMEVVYFLNCPQRLPEPLSRSIIVGLEEVRSPTFVPLRYFMQGRLHEDLKETKLAIQCEREAVRMGDQLCASAASKNALPSCGEHVPAFASYELAVLLCKNKSTYEEGKLFFNKAGDSYKNCHFRNRLHVKIHLAKKTLDES